MGWTYSLTDLAGMVGAAAPAKDAAFEAVSTDTRTLQPGQVFFALSGENFDGNRFLAEAFAKGAVAAVSSSASDAGPCIVVQNPLKALQDFAAAHRQRHPIPIFALTGSCGKTSVKDLTAAVLGSKMNVIKTQGNLNNDIGCPLSLLRIDGDTDMAVIEMGANHMGEIAALCEIARPTEAAITLVAPAHLEGFGSIENVAKAKGEIAQGLGAGGTFYVNTDDEWCVRIGEAYAGEKVYFGKKGNVALQECDFDESGEMRLRISPIGELRLPLHSRAHASNVLLAVAVGLKHGITEFEGPLREACLRTTRFKVFELGSLTVIDDTYNANPVSTAAALEALASRPGTGSRTAVLGDMLELGEAGPALHAGLGALAARLGVERVYTYGPLSRSTVEAALAGGVDDARAFDEHKAIAEAVHAETKAGDVLLVKGSRGMRMENVIGELRKLVEGG